ncbi:MAG: threonine ammonia-lyase [Nocardioidaceae bacterium]|nr:threonine ammonia-lyase [Nocardioidaceae bacterium]
MDPSDAVSGASATPADLTEAGPPVTLAAIEAARGRLAGTALVTPMETSRWLSALTGTAVSLKCENLQRTGSFKIRGAYLRINNLSADERARGVVAASAGNHAQGVALAAQMLGIKATVFMPNGAPIPKEKATRGYGADVEFVGHTIDECLVAAREFEARTGAVLIHPFDHADIVTGQGTCGLEILEQTPDVETVIVPTGGGGFLAGIATAIKAVRTDVRVVGVQAESAAAYPASLSAGKPVPLRSMATMADGIAVGCPGAVPFEAIQRYVDEIRTVSEESLSTALLALLERAKVVVEPAGAAAVAALMDDPTAFAGPVVVVLSGGNIDPLLLMRVIRHGMAAQGRYLAIRCRIPDRPGGLARLLNELSAADANVLDVVHERTSESLPLDQVEVVLQMEMRGHSHSEQVLAKLRAGGYDPRVS